MNGGTTETTSTFTIPATATAGEYRFRLVSKWNSAPAACSNSSYGQTHDYTFTIPNTLPQVQNVNAELDGDNIKVIWQAPAEGTPIGYNVYRNGNKLNGATPLTVLTYTEENVVEGIYVYNITAVYDGNKESNALMSNVICNFMVCEKPVNLQGTSEGKTAILTWEDSPIIEGTLLGYNIYRDGVKLNESLITEKKYKDENLAAGTYKYQVSASYDHCAESDLTDSVSVTVYLACEPPENLKGYQLKLVKGEYLIQLNWDKPENIDGVLLGYNIYRDSLIVYKEISETNFIDIVNTCWKFYSYQVSAVYEHCESALTDTILIYVDENQGINDFQTSSFSIFPNPSTGSVTIEGEGVNRIEIYDVQGRILFEQNAEGRKQNVINVSHLQAGIYFVRIYSENNVAVTKRLVIIK